MGYYAVALCKGSFAPPKTVILAKCVSKSADDLNTSMLIRYDLIIVQFPVGLCNN